MNASPRKIFKTFSHETCIHTNSDYIGDITMPLNYIISKNNRVYHIHDTIDKIMNHMSQSSLDNMDAISQLKVLFLKCDHPIIKSFRSNGMNHIKLGSSLHRLFPNRLR